MLRKIEESNRKNDSFYVKQALSFFALECFRKQKAYFLRQAAIISAAAFAPEIITIDIAIAVATIRIAP